MKPAKLFFGFGYSAIALLFVACAVVLSVFAASELWAALVPAGDIELRGRFNAVLEVVGLLAVAVAALELGQTVFEEEVWREAHVSAPTRVRRFLSRFLIVVVVALSVETLVTVFRLAHDAPEQLPQAAAVGVATAALLAAWGWFVNLNTAAERLEPEAMQKAKEEDRKVE